MLRSTSPSRSAINETRPPALDTAAIPASDVAPRPSAPPLDGWVSSVRTNPVRSALSSAPASSTAPETTAAALTARIAQPRVDTLHAPGETTFLGPWRVKTSALDHRYAGMPDANMFGLVRVALPTGQSYVVRDNQFDLGNGKLGLRLIPVEDRASGQPPVGLGSREMDRYLREAMGLGTPVRGQPQKNAIYASIVFWHPELYAAQGLRSVANEILATEHRETHRGAYLGNGRTTNSPEEYHENQWDVQGDSEDLGYPAHVYQISLAGVDQALYNWQGQMVDRVLNRGVIFPGDYKNDIYRTSDLNTALMEYRDWILEAPYMRTDDSWRQYCAEHKELVEIIRANVPHNRDAFVEIFGDDPQNGGAALWDAFTRPDGAFEKTFRRNWSEAYETHFEPLWKKEGLAPEQIRPWPSIEAYNAYDAARRGGPEALEAYRAQGGMEPLPEGKGMLYRSESTSDLLHDFIATYASFGQAGGIGATAAIMGFKDVAVERLKLGANGSGDQIFLAMALPVIQELLKHEALVAKREVPVPLAIWAKGAEKALLTALGADPASPAPALLELVRAMMAKVDVGAIDQTNGLARAEAHTALDEAIAPLLERARGVISNDPTAIVRNGPPALITRVVQSPERHPVNPHIQIRYLCTAVHNEDLQSTGVSG